MNPLRKSLLFTKATSEFGDVLIISCKSKISEQIGETDNIRFFPRIECRDKLPLFRLPGISKKPDFKEVAVESGRSVYEPARLNFRYSAGVIVDIILSGAFVGRDETNQCLLHDSKLSLVK